MGRCDRSSGPRTERLWSADARRRMCSSVLSSEAAAGGEGDAEGEGQGEGEGESMVGESCK